MGTHGGVTADSDDIGDVDKMTSGSSDIEIEHGDMTSEEEMQPMSSGSSDSGNIGDVDKMSSGSRDMDLFTLKINHGDIAATSEEIQLMISGSSNSGTIGDVDKMSSGRSDMDQPFTPEIKHGDMAVVVVEEEEEMQPPNPKQISEREWRLDERNMALMVPNLTWEQKVLRVLHMIRCQDLTEFNRKLDCSNPTRFCDFNIAFFDLDKESKVKHGPLFCDIPESEYWRLDDSINVISIKVAESEVSGTINIYGTALARDQYDYRCVYLFKRGRDDPQPISLEVTIERRKMVSISALGIEVLRKMKKSSHFQSSSEDDVS